MMMVSNDVLKITTDRSEVINRQNICQLLQILKTQTENSISQEFDNKLIQHITQLQLCSTSVNNMQIFAQMRNLIYVKLIDNNIRDIKIFRTLINITRLDLFRNNIQSVSSLKWLKQLNQLNISYNKVLDISPLSKLNKMVWLFINDNCIVDLSPIEHLYNMDTLWAHNNCIQCFDQIREHKCFNQYQLGNQRIPTTFQLAHYQKMKIINSSINTQEKISTMNTCLKHILKQKLFNIKYNMCTNKFQIINSVNRMLETISSFVNSQYTNQQ
ncbi:leucine-rich_repeat domain-containing protein [Hexamita inflata]|uniref:Leucine-rich_repeat domain-containing protein n=1 Tax=Hexamita inflata TaxID=28002 RepID=A0ABP1HBX4_9EUKA